MVNLGGIRACEAPDWVQRHSGNLGGLEGNRDYLLASKLAQLWACEKRKFRKRVEARIEEKLVKRDGNSGDDMVEKHEDVGKDDVEVRHGIAWGRDEDHRCV